MLPRQEEGFETFACESDTNRNLTKQLLHLALLDRCRRELPPGQFREHPKPFRRRVYLLIREYPEGRQEVWFEPFYLQAARTFGFLVDFTFATQPEHRGSRRAQQLALSLDGRFLANTEFYADRFAKIDGLVRQLHGFLFTLDVFGAAVTISKQLVSLPSSALRPKRYIFGDNRPSASQFVGVKEHGALKPAPPDARLYFLYRPEDKALSQDLYRALTGHFRTFPGFEPMFRMPLGKQNVTGIAMTDFSPEELRRAAGAIECDADGRPAVPIVLTPFDAHDEEDAKAPYWRLKHEFLSRRLPTQVVSINTLRDTNTFKWAVSNIGLGVFAKLGATPWKVDPHTRDCLIIGIGQAHRRDATGAISRYYAYSVLTDSCGIYEEMRVLAEKTAEEDYLDQLRATLRSIIDDYSDRFRSFVVHATFAISWREMEAVRSVLQSAGRQPEAGRLISLKFDEDSKFFGYDFAHNSYVPYESTFVRLDRNEYLIWFEGLQFHNATVRKRYGRPLHVRFDYPRGDLAEREKLGYLQDAVNLSGATWRGFNAKSLPVSVYYAKIIARYIGRFQEFGLPEIDFTGLPPWFL
ncbi:MAG: hypothetical protein KDB18_11925 [Salinibacterium sp.]|nr:hypothetical protein [Salinibacterium sp.]